MICSCKNMMKWKCCGVYLERHQNIYYSCIWRRNLHFNPKLVHPANMLCITADTPEHHQAALPPPPSAPLALWLGAVVSSRLPQSIRCLTCSATRADPGTRRVSGPGLGTGFCPDASAWWTPWPLHEYDRWGSCRGNTNTGNPWNHCNRYHQQQQDLSQWNRLKESNVVLNQLTQLQDTCCYCRFIPAAAPGELFNIWSLKTKEQFKSGTNVLYKLKPWADEGVNL